MASEEVERLVDATVATPTVPATVWVETVLQRTNRLIMLTRMETLSELIVIGHPTLADTPRRRSVAWSTTSWPAWSPLTGRLRP